MRLYRIDRIRAAEHALVYRRTPDTTAHTHDPQEILRRLFDAEMIFEVEPDVETMWCFTHDLPAREGAWPGRPSTCSYGDLLVWDGKCDVASVEIYREKD